MKNKKFISTIFALLMYVIHLVIGIYIGCVTHAKYGFLYFVGILIYTLYIAFRENMQWKEFDEKYCKQRKRLPLKSL